MSALESLSRLTYRQKVLLALVTLCALGLAVYSNTLYSPFEFDDFESIEFNSKLRSLGNFIEVPGTRYVAYLTFALNYAVGGTNTFGYHLVNTFIHVLNAISVFFLVTLTFRTPAAIAAALDAASRQRLSFAAAFAASLIFLVHPVQTQAVTYLSQRIASLATLFYLLSFLSYVKFRLSAGKYGGAWGYYALCVVFAVVAQLTKEISFTLPAVIALYEVVFLDDGRGAAKRSAYLVPVFLCLAVIPLILFASKPSAGASLDIVSKVGGIAREDLSTLSRHDYLVTEFRVIVTYLRLLVLPVAQNIDYDYPVYRTLATPQVFFSFVLLASIFSFGVWLCWRSRKKGEFLALVASFGILWFFITLSVESSVIPISDVIFEHRVYLPSIGAFAAFASLLVYVKERLKLHVLFWMFVAVIAASLSVASIVRNSLWRDGVTLWQDSVSKSPNKARGYNNIGYALVAQGKKTEAIAYFEKVIRLKPDFYGAYNNLGEALVDTGNTDGSIVYFKEAVRLKPDFWLGYYNLGNALLLAGRAQESLEYFSRAIKLKGDYWNAYNGMGMALAQLKRYDEALTYFDKAGRLAPGSADVECNIGNVMLMDGRVDDAIARYRRALELDPSHVNSRVNLENALRIREKGR